MTDGTSRSTILPQIIVAVAIALLVGGTAPWWWKEVFGPRPNVPPQTGGASAAGSAQAGRSTRGPTEPENQPEVGGPIAVRCDAIPPTISAGGTSELLIRATSSRNTPVSSANVQLYVGGGSFSSGGTTVVGTTEADGAFRTVWRAPSPAARGYGVSVEVVKSGFDKGTSECTVNVQ